MLHRLEMIANPGMVQHLVQLDVLIAKNIISSIKKTLGRKFLNVFIREDVSADESQIRGKLLHDYAPGSRIMEDYTKLSTIIEQS